MLSKKERLTKNDFSRSFSSGKRLHHSLFTLIYSPSPAFHASVVVSKKHAAKAVVRNRVRRRVYRVLSRLGKGEGTFIVLVKKEGVNADAVAFSAALTPLVGRIDDSR